ncbi:hypothetical protein BHS04_14270 [Myxococcus xanthus]|nr:hypothetical protein BHS04_14270 [Myxococcus xanthus]
MASLQSERRESNEDRASRRPEVSEAIRGVLHAQFRVQYLSVADEGHAPFFCPEALAVQAPEHGSNRKARGPLDRGADCICQSIAQVWLFAIPMSLFLSQARR